ncbi:hypothetical protein D3C78_1721840 [compost metagenome]
MLIELPAAKIAVTLMAVPITVPTSTVVLAAAAIPEMLNPSAWDRLKPMVWLASAPTWKLPL